MEIDVVSSTLAYQKPTRISSLGATKHVEDAQQQQYTMKHPPMKVLLLERSPSLTILMVDSRKPLMTWPNYLCCIIPAGPFGTIGMTGSTKHTTQPLLLASQQTRLSSILRQQPSFALHSKKEAT